MRSASPGNSPGLPVPAASSQTYVHNMLRHDTSYNEEDTGALTFNTVLHTN